MISVRAMVPPELRSQLMPQITKYLHATLRFPVSYTHLTLPTTPYV